MKKKIFFFFLVIYLALFSANSQVSKEQIEETKMAIKKEKLLEEKCEKRTKELVNALAEEAKKIDYYVFEKNKEDGKIYFYPNIEKIQKNPIYEELKRLHFSVHCRNLWDWDEEQCTIFSKEFRKWNIVNGKIHTQEDNSKYTIIENTICPICRACVIDNASQNTIYYIVAYDNAHSDYLDKVKLFGYWVKNRKLIPGYYEAIKKNNESYIPLYGMAELLEEYADGWIKARETDEFCINGDVENYQKKWNGKLVKVKAKVSYIRKTVSSIFDTNPNPLWQIDLSDSYYYMSIYIERGLKTPGKYCSRLFDEDIIKLKENDEITFITVLRIDNDGMRCISPMMINSNLYFGYSEIIKPTE